MELPKLDLQKLPNFIMCGDHSSFTKPEMVSKERPSGDSDRLPSSARVSPVASKTEKAVEPPGSPRGTSEHGLRPIETRRRNRSLEAVSGDHSAGTPPNKMLLHAALGSFRWPPYLLLVWMALLLLTHLLHCLLTLLTSVMPHVKKLCNHFRKWTEHTWRQEPPAPRLYPTVLAGATGCLYSLYFCMYAVYSVVLWSIEPLNSEALYDKVGLEAAEDKTKVTNYIDETKESKITL